MFLTYKPDASRLCFDEATLPKEVSLLSIVVQAIYIIMKYYSSMRTKDILSFAPTCLDLIGVMLRGLSQTEKDT